MAQKAVSWALVGAFTYVWWWIGYVWEYLNSADPVADWTDLFLLFTLISLVLLRGGGSSGGGDGMFDKLIKTVTGFLPNLPWLIVAVLAGETVYVLHSGIFLVDNYIAAVVTAVAAGVTTVLWVGAIFNAGD